MTLALFLGYVGTVAVLTLSPGPSTMLGSAHGMAYGPRGTLFTIAGDLSANVLQMIAAILGLGAIITRSETVFLYVKWAGVAYLVWIAIGYFRRPAPTRDDSETQSHRAPLARYFQGFVTSASNPKAVVFFAALFPQFIDTSAPLAGQFAILAVSFLVLDGLSVLLYAATAGRMAQWLARGGRAPMQRRITGTVLLAAAGLLSLKGAPAAAE